MLVEATGPPGHHETRRESLEVPLERAMKRLVEIVDVEHEVPLGRGEKPEVGQVGVAAHLDDDPGVRCRSEVGGHRQRGTAVERERRDGHATVSDRDELGDPRRRLLLEQRHGVGAIGGRLPLRLGGDRQL